MFAVVRLLARPVSIVVLAALAVPAVALDCRPSGATPADQMPCCKKQLPATAGLDAGCCNIRQPAPLSDRSPSVPAKVKHSAAADGRVDSTASAPVIDFQLTARTRSADPVRPPSDPLYLRLSVIRR